ncbi:MAG: DUF3291 domain-containing protein [Pseudomonadota bacterium]
MSHIAQLNIARPRFELDDPRIAEFMNGLDRVNAIAERSAGFVWRLTGDGNNATDLRIPDEPSAILNMSVWQSVGALRDFVFATIHKRFLMRKAEWFQTVGAVDFVMWPVPEGHRPDVPEALARLSLLRASGPSDQAFGWAFAKRMGWLSDPALADVP